MPGFFQILENCVCLLTNSGTSNASSNRSKTSDRQLDTTASWRCILRLRTLHIKNESLVQNKRITALLTLPDLNGVRLSCWGSSDPSLLVDPMTYLLLQPVFHNWCNKGRAMCYPVCGMVHIRERLLLIEKNNTTTTSPHHPPTHTHTHTHTPIPLEVASAGLVSLSEGTKTIIGQTSYNRK